MNDDSNMWRKVLKDVSELQNEVGPEIKVSNKASGFLKSMGQRLKPRHAKVGT